MTSARQLAYIRRPDLNAVSMDGELVMMGVKQGEYFGLRDVAASIWTHLESAHTVGELSALVADEYAIGAPDCEDDVERFLDSLLAKKLIEKVD